MNSVTPPGDWFIIRATVHDQEAAEHYASLYKEHNPRLRFRYRLADEDGEPLADRRTNRSLISLRKQTLPSLLLCRGCELNAPLLTHPGDLVFEHACKIGLEGIVSKRLGSTYRSGRTSDWLKFKNPEAPAVKRGAEEDWGK